MSRPRSLSDGLTRGRLAGLSERLQKHRWGADVSEGMLPFVRGLFLSAQLTYEIRLLLVEGKLQAHWGHVLGRDDSKCSRECDIIVHQGGKEHCWNGEHKDPVMDFWFINPSAVRAVVSCKTTIRRASEVDGSYAKDLRAYGVNRLWLFAESCHAGRVPSITQKARKAGYDRFFHLYTLDTKTGATMPSESSWLAFMTATRKLEQTRQRTQR